MSDSYFSRPYAGTAGTPEASAAGALNMGAQPQAAPGLGIAGTLPQPQPEAPLIDYKQNPLGAAGLVLSNAAAGISGGASPVDALKKHNMAVQEMQMKSAELAQSVIERYAPILANEDPKNWDATLAHQKQIFGGALGGIDIGPITKELAGATAARRTQLLGALKVLPPEAQKIAMAAVSAGTPIDKVLEPFIKQAAEGPKVPTTRQVREGGDIVNQEYDPATAKWKEVGRGPAQATTKVDVTLGAENAFGKMLGEGQAKAFTDQQTAAKSAASTIQNLETVRPLIDKGMFTGPFAQWKLQGAKLLGVAPEAVANTETFGATMAKQTAEIIKAFGSGTGLSDADREYAIKAAGGDITFNADSLKKLFDIHLRAAHGAIRDFNKRAADVQASPSGKNLPPLSVDEPFPTLSPEEARKKPSGTKFYATDGRLLEVP